MHRESGIGGASLDCIKVRDKTELMANLRTVIHMLCENTALEKKQTELREEVEEAAALAEQCVSENARIALDQNEYAERYERLVQRYEKAKSELDAVMQELSGKEM